MNHYDEKEIEALSDKELEQFLSIANKMLERAIANKTKTKIALDQVQKLYERIDLDLQDDEGYDAWNQCPYSYADLKAVGKKVVKYESKLSALHQEIVYLLGTIEKTETEKNIRLSVKHNDCRYLILGELDDIFGEE